MFKKIFIGISLAFFIFVIGFIVLQVNDLQKETTGKGFISPISFPVIGSTPTPESPKFSTTLPTDGSVFNVLLMGSDRRSKSEGVSRTDIMILVSINPKSKKVVLTSVPRDLWVNGGRVNAVYVQSGWDGMKSAFENITGQQIDRFIFTDFEDFSWVVDAMDGVEVAVDTTFTDTEFPNDVTKTYRTVTFAQGPEKLTGERALIFARSRHGNNGEGSDWMRMRRQHKILKGMLNSVLSPKSIFNPMVVEQAFKTVTEGRMDTNLTLGDAAFLWDFYKDKDAYEIESLFMDSDYVYNPPMEDYGGAWVLVPRNGYSAFHEVVKSKLYPTPTPSISVTTTP